MGISLGKVAYYLSYPILRIMGSTIASRRVRIAVYAPDGRILLVKSWFGRQRWSLPGGGIERNETAEQAAIRELREETAITARIDDLRKLGEMKGKDGLPFHLIVYRLNTKSDQLLPLARGRAMEITAREWFMPSNLPDDVSPAVEWALKR